MSSSSSSLSSDSSSSFWEAKGVTVVTSEYDFSGNIISAGTTSVLFGTVSSGGYSSIKIVGMTVTGAIEVGNIKIGITNCDYKGSIGSLFSYKIFDKFPYDSSSMNPFPGRNTTGKSNNPNNVLVGNSGSTSSMYMAVMASVPSGVVDPVHCRFTWFFDYNIPSSEIQESLTNLA